MVKKLDVDLKRIADKNKLKLRTFIQEFSSDIAETVVTRTPVDTGFLRGSWFASINSQGTFHGEPDKGGSNTIGRISVTLNGVEVGDTVYLLNQASYAGFVENGTSRMAPRAFVASTVNDATQIAERTAAKLRRK